jgi:hypothetical protein
VSKDRIVDGLAAEVVLLRGLLNDVAAVADDQGLFDDEKLARIRTIVDDRTPRV